MAETQQKRPREEETIEFDDSNSNSNSKRQKPYNNILSILDEEEECEEQNQDLLAIFSTLQQEIISSPTASDFDSPPFTAEEDQKTSAGASTSALCRPSSGNGADEDESAKSVMRHLLEASDDELGIPNTKEHNNVYEISSNENFPFAFVDNNGLWELEDVAANYYTMLQSELFPVLGDWE